MARSATKNGPHPVDVQVGRRVCQRRVHLGHNQSELGRALGLTFQQIQKYERGTNRISCSKLWDIAKFLDVDVTYFFEEIAGGRPSVAQTRTEVEDGAPVTQQSVEISRIVPQLSTKNQRLTLALLKEMKAIAAE